MSRSYREPYMSPIGGFGPGHDRKIARRNVRHREKAHIFQHWKEYDSFLLPHKYECSWNDPWGWVTDGKPNWQEYYEVNNYPTLVRK